MIKEKFIAIIPARKGSKRLPNKNILDLRGKPLIAWTIEAAKKSKYFKKIVVSTDSEEIIKIAHELGIEAPFKRPEHLSSDTASSVDVVLHVLDYYKSQGIEFEYLVLLQPTSPIRTSTDIDNAIELLLEKNANSITSVCEMEHSPLWSNILPPDGSMDNFIRKDVIGKRSQDLEKYYRLNGALYIIKTDIFEEEGKFIANSRSFAFKMDKKASVDIDDEIDFKLSSVLLH